mmetsp:Transcript_26332/g.47483  ORF Transcript_26332/g.47483 Transcript_26332/m.47483 type:complete len:137 (+) Transcript_26332:989-1399(+)
MRHWSVARNDGRKAEAGDAAAAFDDVADRCLAGSSRDRWDCSEEVDEEDDVDVVRVMEGTCHDEDDDEDDDTRHHDEEAAVAAAVHRGMEKQRHDDEDGHGGEWGYGQSLRHYCVLADGGKNLPRVSCGHALDYHH